MNKQDTQYYNNFRRKHQNTTCEFCKAAKAVDAHHISGRSGEYKHEYDTGETWEEDCGWVHPVYETKTIRNGKLLIALCRPCHNLAHRYLTDLRPLLLKICLERQPTLLQQEDGDG